MAAAVGGASVASSTRTGAISGDVGHSLSRRGLVDVHAHFIPDFYRRAAIAAGHEKPDGFPGFPSWNEVEMLRMMDGIGISTAMLSISSPGTHFGQDEAARELSREVNLEGARLKSAHPGRFGHFASIPLPDVSGSLREISFALDELGADGIVIESNSNGIYPGDARFEAVFAELDRRSAVVFMHPTSPQCTCCSLGNPDLPRPILEFMFETARAVTNLILSGTLHRFRKLKLIIPHAGATVPVLADRIATAAAILPGMAIAPTSVLESLSRLYYDLAGAPVPRLLPALRTFAQPDHLLYGSDWPFTPVAAVGKLLSQLEGFIEGDPALAFGIRRGNAQRLFPNLLAGAH